MTLLFLAFALAVAFVGFVVLVTVFKLAIRLILLPLLLIKWIVGGLVMLILSPILALVGIFLAVVFGLLLAVPLLPFVVAAGLIWLLVRAGRRSAFA